MENQLFRKFIILTFVLLPFIWAGFLTSQIYLRGDAGFSFELGWKSFKVMEVYKNLNPIHKGDEIKFIDSFSINKVLGFCFSPVKKYLFKGLLIVERGKKELSIQLSYANFSWLSYLAVCWPYFSLALLLVASGVIAYVNAPQDQPSGLFLGCFIAFAINIMNEVGFNFGIHSPYLISLAFFIATLSNWVGFSLWTHFIGLFPTKEKLFKDNSPMLFLIYLGPPVVSILAAFCLSHQGEFFIYLQRTRFWHIPPILGFTVCRNWTTFKRSKEAYIKNQLKWIFLGGILGITPYFLFYLLPHLVMGYPIINFKIAMFFGGFIPISFLLAILRYRLMDIDEIMSTTLTYIILLSGLYIAYMGTLVTIKNTLWNSRILTKDSFVIYLLIIALFFDPAKNKIKLFIDKAFFKDKVDYQKLLHHYTLKVTTSLNRSELIDLLIKQIPQDFHISSGCVMIIEGRRSYLYPQHLRFGNAPWSYSALVKALNNEKTNYIICELTKVSDFRLAKEMEEIIQAGYRLVLPLKGGKSFIGMFFLGPKQGGSLYTSADIQALTTLTSHISFVMENVLIYDSLQNSKQQLQEIYPQLLQLEQMARIGEMASMVAHEIRNPLGIIRSSAQYLLEDLYNSESSKELLDFIVDEIDRLNQVVNNLLDIARVKLPSFSEVYIDELITQMLEQWEKSHNHNPTVVITQTGSPGRRPIYADEKQLRQVFLNLIQNSEEAMPDGGKLNINFSEDQINEGVIVSVCDTGQGISEEVAKDVFKKFYTTKENGLGLGLAICQQIIEAHKGKISFKSVPGKGTTVTVWLPRRPHYGLGDI